MESARFTSDDFKNQRFNVLAVKDKTILKAFPELQRYEEFNVVKTKVKVDPDMLIRYAFLMYSDNILFKTIPDLLLRKKQAAILAGFSIENKRKRFPKEVENMFYCKPIETAALIMRVIRLSRNPYFEQLCVYDQARAQEMENLLKGGEEGRKLGDIHNNIRKLTADIMELRNIVLLQDDTPALLDRMYYELENFQLGIRPEEIAEAKRKGSLRTVLPDVYKQNS